MDHPSAQPPPEYGLEPEQLTITDEAMHQIISGYTREAGVRNLERKIGEICRKAAREIYEGTCESVFVDEKQLEQYLGKERFHVDRINEQDEIGIVRGLAWTSVGGDTLQIEVNLLDICFVKQNLHKDLILCSERICFQKFLTFFITKRQCTAHYLNETFQLVEPLCLLL